MKKPLIILVFLMFLVPIISYGLEDRDEFKESSIQEQVRMLYKQATKYHKAGELEKALEHYSMVIELDPENVDSNYNRAEIYYKQEKYELAISDFHKINDFAPNFADAFGFMGWCLILQGKYEEARKPCLKAYKLDSKCYVWIVNLGHTYLLTSDQGAAREYYKESLKQIKSEEEFEACLIADFKLFIDKGWNVQESKQEMDWVRGEYTRIRREIDKAKELHQKAIKLYNIGKYVEAIKYAKMVLEISESVLDEEDPRTIADTNNLAAFYNKMGQYVESASLYRRALDLSIKTLKEGDPKTAIKQNNLADLYVNMGRYAEAEPLYQRALETLGEEHSDSATIINNLADIYCVTGRYNKAEPLIKKALDIRKNVLGEEHPDTLNSMNNLAALYRITGRYIEAVHLYENLVVRYTRVLGEKHPDVVTTFSNLAGCYKSIGNYKMAEDLYKRAIKIREEVLGKEHPSTAMSVNNLAELYKTTGQYAEAEPLHKKALEIWENMLGGNHSNTAQGMRNLAEFYAVTERYLESHKLFSKGVSNDDKTREIVFMLFSEKEKLNYMTQNKFKINLYISNSLQHMRDNNGAIVDTFNAWLKWKGAVMEAQGRYIDALFHSDDPEISKKYGELTNVRREMGRILISDPGMISPEAYKMKLEELEMTKEILEAELSRLSKDFALEKMVGKADVDNVSRILPEDSVYLDFASINMYNFKEKKWESSRYIAFVLIPGKVPVVELIGIGETEEIDKQINSYLKEINRAKEQLKLPRQHILKKRGNRIYETVLKPLEAYIKGKKSIYISPDGSLNLMPFEVLMKADGRCLIEEYEINYIAAGRDIVRFTDTSHSIGDAVIIADPDYDMGLEEKEREVKALKLTGLELRGGIVSRDAVRLEFDRLSDTKEEADEIEKVLEKQFKIKVQNYQDKKALEEVLFSVVSPKILHLSTHGYFLNDEETKGLKKEVFARGGIDMIPNAGIENPMLRSGIVLAGVNKSLKEGRDYGMVSSEKILGMKLRGTDLVVLSACETGVGDVQNGEGVFGLKRSFILSGAKTVVMSLWSVPSKETRELMVEFYTQMAKGKTKAESLRLAKINMMRRVENPFYWGAFILVGNPE